MFHFSILTIVLSALCREWTVFEEYLESLCYERESIPQLSCPCLVRFLLGRQVLPFVSNWVQPLRVYSPSLFERTDPILCKFRILWWKDKTLYIIIWNKWGLSENTLAGVRYCSLRVSSHSLLWGRAWLAPTVCRRCATLSSKSFANYNFARNAAKHDCLLTDGKTLSLWNNWNVNKNKNINKYIKTYRKPQNVF